MLYGGLFSRFSLLIWDVVVAVLGWVQELQQCTNCSKVALQTHKTRLFESHPGCFSLILMDPLDPSSQNISLKLFSLPHGAGIEPWAVPWTSSPKRRPAASWRLCWLAGSCPQTLLSQCSCVGKKSHHLNKKLTHHDTCLFHLTAGI